MTWTTVSSSGATWTAGTGSSMTWSGVTEGVCPPAWGIMSSVTTSVDEGVDFNLLIRDVGFHSICSDLPVTIRELQPEGMP